MSYNLDIPFQIEFGYKETNTESDKETEYKKYFKFSHIDNIELNEFMYGDKYKDKPSDAPEILEQEFKKKLNEYILKKKEKNVDSGNNQISLYQAVQDLTKANLLDKESFNIKI